MKKLITKILGSLDTHTKDSFSARKLSAAVVMALVIVLHFKWFKSDRWEYSVEILICDFTFILVCLGLATWQYLKENKNENNTTDTINATIK